jgi:hypothetical protein
MLTEMVVSDKYGKWMINHESLIAGESNSMVSWVHILIQYEA